MIGVKNRDTQKLTALYDGKKFEFPADEKVTTPISEEAARHIFGYGERDKTRALLRLGWVQNGANVEAAEERLGRFQFLAVEDIKFKEDSGDSTLHLPRKVASDGPANAAPLSAEEQAHAETLKKPQQGQQKFR